MSSARGITRVEWRTWAACRQVEDPEVFFPERNQSGAEALRLCRSCRVLAACRDQALRTPERFGVWGGLTEVERERIRVAAGFGRRRRRTPWGLRRSARPGA